MTTPAPIVALVGGAELPEVRRAVARRGLSAVALADAEALGRVPEDPAVLDRVAVDWTRPARVVQALLDLHRRLGLAGIVGATEHGLLPAAFAAERLGLPTPPTAAVRRTRDKLAMRRRLADAGFDRPRFALCRGPEHVEGFLASVGGPIVVKPSAGTGSEAVRRVDSARDAAGAFAAAAAALGGGGVLCEEYVEGPEVSVEGVVAGGRFTAVAVTDKRTGAGFVETGHRQPTAHAAAEVERAVATTAAALAALGVDRAVTHTELRLGGGAPTLIETHTRMGGDQIHRLTERTAGVDLADVAVALALGEEPNVAPSSTGVGAAVRFLVAGPGRLAAIEPPADGLFVGVEATHLAVEAGRPVAGCRSSADRLGWALAVAADADAAERAAAGWLGAVRLSWAADGAREEPWRAAS